MMDRKEFIKTCGLSCLSLVGISTLLESCTATKNIEATTQDQKLRISRSDFMHENSKKFRRYVIVRTATLKYPVVVYRISDSEYRAMLLECTHQYSELNVNGDVLSCSAHGSEFNNKGEVVQGPAELNLRQYKTSLDQENIIIHLA